MKIQVPSLASYHSLEDSRPLENFYTTFKLPTRALALTVSSLTRVFHIAGKETPHVNHTIASSRCLSPLATRCRYRRCVDVGEQTKIPKRWLIRLEKWIGHQHGFKSKHRGQPVEELRSPIPPGESSVFLIFIPSESPRVLKNLTARDIAFVPLSLLTHKSNRQLGRFTVKPSYLRFLRESC